MRFFLTVLLLVAVLVHNSHAQNPTAWQYLLNNTATYSNYISSINALLTNPATANAGDTIIAILNGTATSPAPSTITLFLPSNAVATTILTLAQLQLSIVVAYDGVPGAVLYSSSTAGAILTTLYVEPLLGLTPTGLSVPGGTPGQQAIKLGKIGSTYTVLASPNVAPVIISTSDILVSNGAIQIYTTGNVLTPAPNAETVLTGLTSPYSTFFSYFVGAIGASLAGWTALNNLTNPLVTGSIGYTLLLPTNNGLVTLEAETGPGILGYLTTSAGGAQAAADFANIFSYHIIPTPGFSVGYSYALEYALTLAGGARNFTSALFVNYYPQQLQLSLTSTGLNATSFATFTAPIQIGGADIIFQAPVPLDLIIANGVVHGLQGLLLPTAIPFLLPKVIIGGGFTNLTHYLALTNLTSVLNNIASPFTVLAPTDSAFLAFVANYPTLASNITVLTEILTLHVISGYHATTIGKVGTLPNATYATLLSGSSVVVGAASNYNQTVTVLNGGSSATLDATQTSLAQNGYVYSINTVLLPASLDPSTPTPTATTTAVPTSTTTAVPTPTRTNPPTSPPTAPNATPTPTGNASLVSMSVVGVIAAVFVALTFRA